MKFQRVRKMIDGKGLQVYPGLFDPVTQMGLSEISAVSATVDTTETGSINPDVVAADAVSAFERTHSGHTCFRHH